jgi:hypothetical protein
MTASLASRSTALCRGRVLVPLRAIVKETFGDTGWKRLLGELSPKQAQVLCGLIVPDAWYERSLHLSFMETSLRLWSSEVPDLGRRMGIRAARHNDRFYMRPLLKLGGPVLIAGRAAAIYREYFQGSELAIVERRDCAVRVRLDDPLAPRAFCEQVMTGYLEELVRLTGRTPIRVEQDVCRFRSADHCEICWIKIV